MKRTIASAGVDEYDTMGESIISTSNESTAYTYDQAGQLKTAYNSRTGIKYYYTYDANGNIVCREEYSVAFDNTETLIEKITYVYSGTVLVMSYSTVDGYVRYTNDNMGNPTKIQKGTTTYNLTWGEGRMLKGISKDNSNNVTYSYNVDGLRTQKVVKENGVSTVTEYVWGNNGLAGMQTEMGTVIVLYDAEGQPVGFSLNGTVYHYVKNLQGDVVRILDDNGNTVVEYSYDPWGVPAVTGDTELAKVNPCSYRGYDYDEETGYYYLQSRYYDPEIGRFISGDEPLLLKELSELQGINLYIYCTNNPVNKVDANGFLDFPFKVYVVAAVTAAVISAISKIIGNYAKGLRGWSLFRGVLGTTIGNSVNTILLMKLIRAGTKGLVVAAFTAAVVQTVIDFAEGVLVDKKYRWKQLKYDFVINFAATLVGNYIGAKKVYINGYWFTPQTAKSFFRKSYGKRLISQTGIGAAVSLLIDLVRGRLENSVKT